MSNANDNTQLFQVGSSAYPAQIVWAAHPRDAQKKNNSIKVVVRVEDDATLSMITKLEEAVALANPGLELNSCVGELVRNPHNIDETGFGVRLKLTKNGKCYKATDPWESGAAQALEGLEYGHLCLFKCRAMPWTYKNACGITLYANLVNGVGSEPQPWGRADLPQKAAVQWS